MNRETILCEIETADMILIGLGEEFNNRKTVHDNERYKRLYEKIQKSAYPWLIPALNAHEIDDVPHAYHLLLLLQQLQRRPQLVLLHLIHHRSPHDVVPPQDD